MRRFEVGATHAEDPDPETPAAPGTRVGGYLVVIAGLVIGIGAEHAAAQVISRSWSYCFDMPWPMVYDVADSPRFYSVEMVGYAVLYGLCLPLGFWIARHLLASHGHRSRVVAGLLSATVLLSVVFAGDLMLNVSAPHGAYLPARCPAGHPPWWHDWLPARDAQVPHATGR